MVPIFKFFSSSEGPWQGPIGSMCHRDPRPYGPKKPISYKFPRPMGIGSPYLCKNSYYRTPIDIRHVKKTITLRFLMDIYT